MSTVVFTLLTVFAPTRAGGNPAAVVFLPAASPKPSTAALQQIAANLNQPITVFLSPSDALEQGLAKFDVRWFTSTMEMRINGHGLVAAAGALFSQPGCSLSTDGFAFPQDTAVIQFRSSANVKLIARQHIIPNWYELELPASLTTPIPLDSDEGGRLSLVIRRALGQGDREDIIKYIGQGGKGYETYIMVEVDRTLDLGACEVDAAALTETKPYTINVLTSQGGDGSVAFVSRMFAPSVGLPEDHVCGSAHALLAPYYTLKQRTLSQTPSVRGNTQLVAKQVSKRGGDLRVHWDEEREVVKIAGEVVRIGSGVLEL